VPGTENDTYFFFIVCMFFNNVEIIVNGGGDMKKKLTDLAQKEGFILLLFVCVCVVAGGTLFVSMKSLNSAKKNQGNTNFNIVEEDVGVESSTYDENSDLAMATDKEEEIRSSEDDIEEVVEVILSEDDYAEIEVEGLEFEEEVQDSELVVETISFSLPSDGQIVTEYTSNSLVYSETLESWVGHGAIDISGKEGTPVKAAMDGTVKEVYEDELWGTVIVVSHKDEIETRYSNLGTKEMVKVGTNVKKGDHISTIGKTAKIEMLMEPHIHFEVRKNGKIVDPRSIMD